MDKHCFPSKILSRVLLHILQVYANSDCLNVVACLCFVLIRSFSSRLCLSPRLTSEQSERWRNCGVRAFSLFLVPKSHVEHTNREFSNRPVNCVCASITIYRRDRWLRQQICTYISVNDVFMAVQPQSLLPVSESSGFRSPDRLIHLLSANFSTNLPVDRNNN